MIRLLFISTLLLGLFFATSCRNNNKTVYSDTLSYQVVTQQLSFNQCNPDSDDCSYIYHEYIKFDEQNEHAVKLNKLLSGLLGTSKGKTIAQNQEVFMKEFEQYKKSYPDAPQVWFSRNIFSVPYQTNKLVCLSVDAEDYTGGAHGMYVIAYVNYHKTTKDTLGLQQLFSVDNLKEVSKLAEGYFRKNASMNDTTSFEEAGFWFSNEEFHLNNNFTFSDEGITWLFNPYEIAPFAFGTIEVSLSKEELLKYIQPAYKDIWD